MPERLPRFQAWAGEVTVGLDANHSEDPVLRAFLYTVTARRLPHHWVKSYVQGTAQELHFTGFTTEAYFQRYVADVSPLSLMLLEALQHPGGGDKPFRDRCRLFAEGCLDHLADLKEDLSDGRLYLPQEDLDYCGATCTALERGEDTPATRALVTLTCHKIRKALSAARALLDSTAPDFQPLQRALLDLSDHQLPHRAQRHRRHPPLCGPQHRPTAPHTDPGITPGHPLPQAAPDDRAALSIQVGMLAWKRLSEPLSS
ncbi:squalene/phytoene synthase family protein [Streptomyces sp. NPDC059003]|uniref:squalene/phytoene synthase family protein n=1 Tax=Streptomyces sp. NPDC059003 TaxID=3346691 RepID=UPI0036BBDB78